MELGVDSVVTLPWSKAGKAICDSTIYVAGAAASGAVSVAVAVSQTPLGRRIQDNIETLSLNAQLGVNGVICEGIRRIHQIATSNLEFYQRQQDKLNRRLRREPLEGNVVTLVREMIDEDDEEQLVGNSGDMA